MICARARVDVGDVGRLPSPRRPVCAVGMRSRAGRGVAGLAFALTAAYAALHVMGRTSGSSAAERRRALPGDDVVPDAPLVTNHAITIAAGPAAVWPWLTQMGWHRAGWYTPGWVDRLLFPANWPSSDVLDPDLVRDLRVGDTIPDGPPGTAFFVVEQVEAPRVLVLHSTTHLPQSWAKRWQAGIDWTWALNLDEVPGGTRVLLRVRGRTWPWWLSAAYQVAIVPADAIMAGGMLRGLRRRAEARARHQEAGTIGGRHGRSGARLGRPRRRAQHDVRTGDPSPARRSPRGGVDG